MRTLTATLVSLSLLSIALPVAAAAPECLMVYPWSELCQGDVEGFQEAVVDDDVCYQEPSHVTRCRDLTQTIGLRAGLPEVGGWDCAMVYPWSELCGGDVGGFLEAMGVGVQVECIQAHPWSDLCAGDVGGFVCYYACDLIVLS